MRTGVVGRGGEAEAGGGAETGPRALLVTVHALAIAAERACAAEPHLRMLWHSSLAWFALLVFVTHPVSRCISRGGRTVASYFFSCSATVFVSFCILSPSLLPHWFDTIAWLSATKPSPDHSASFASPVLAARRSAIAARCRRTSSLCVVKKGSEAPRKASKLSKPW